MPLAASASARRIESRKFELPPSTRTSPDSSSSPTARTLLSVGFPAGTMSQTVRGGASSLTNAFRLAAESAPAWVTASSAWGSRS